MAQILVDKNGYLTAIAFEGENGGIDVDTEFTNSEDMGPIRCYRFTEGILLFDAEKAAALERAQEIEDIRRRREQECFPVVNRGMLWQETLTAEQLEALRRWYQEWLNAPQTGVIPNKLTFF